MNRRSFFKFLPIAPVALATEGAQACNVDYAPPKGQVHITLQGSKPSNRSANTSLGFGYLNEPDLTRQVSMGVGEDGNLWLKTTKGEWKRVVTE
jgi:hypothetical protein